MHFSTTPVTESIPLHSFEDNLKFSVGGRVHDKYAEDEFEGIIYSLRIADSAKSLTTLQNDWLAPTTTGAELCGYYVAMFDDFSNLNTGRYVRNSLNHVDGQSISLQDTNYATTDPDDGLELASGDTQMITGVSILVQLWYSSHLHQL